MSRGHTSKLLRQILRANTHGMTTPELVNITGITPDGMRKALRGMPDTYIAEWREHPVNRTQMAVWKVVVPPTDAPCPTVPSWKGRGFKPANPNWLEIAQKREARRKRSMQLEADRKAKKAVTRVAPSDMKPKRVDETPKQRHVPEKTVWQPVKPWSEV